MARISLRAYNREIESLIDRGHYEQAIAHCRHILKYYTKHIDTYRLLGKAFLESQRYGDAADIFQRIISSIPDDFVSHVGMSIVREDEGNIDEALWHIERAYEVQPGNKAIQGELRRLYGRRDGMEPPKIQLTRGALARMYLKGELYQQAISELRPAISESKQRPDLLVVLARAYHSSGQRVHAADTCSSLLKNYPYCLVANRILADILSGSERAEEANVYLKRAIALDPYLAQISPQTPTVDQVPETAVVLEKLDWTPDSATEIGTSQPEWASSLGVKVENLEESDDSLPDWLASQPESVEKSSETSQEITSDEIPPEQVKEIEESVKGSDLPVDNSEHEEIPVWMKDAGWVPATGELNESTPQSDYDKDEYDSAELAPAEMPEWLQDMAPEEDSVGDSQGDEQEKDEGEVELPTGSDVLPWLDEKPPGSTDTVVTFLEDKDSPLPDSAEIDLDSDESIEVPAWLQDIQKESNAETEREQLISQTNVSPGEAIDVPVAKEKQPASLDIVDEHPELDEVLDRTEAVEGAVDIHEDVKSEEELPQWLADLEAGVSDDNLPEETSDLRPTEEGEPDWLRALTSEKVIDSIEPTTRESEMDDISEDREEDAWVVDPNVRLTEDRFPEMDSQKSSEIDADSDWMQEFESATDVSKIDEDKHEDETPESELYAPQVSSPDSHSVDESPLDEAPTEVPTFEQTDDQIAEGPIYDSEPDQDDIEDDEAFAWLESLAEKQGATEAMLLSPDERQDEPPEWIQQASEDQLIDSAQGVSDKISEEEDEALPDWLKTESQIDEKGHDDQRLDEQPSEEELPDWLVGEVEDVPTTIAEEKFEQELATEIEGEPDFESEGDLPSWLQTGAAVAGAAALGAAASSSDDQQTSDDEILYEEEVVSPSVDLTDETKVPGEVDSREPDWLREEEAAPIADAELDFVDEITMGTDDIESAELETSEVPDWIKEISPEPSDVRVETASPSTEMDEILKPQDKRVTSPESKMLFAPIIKSFEDVERPEEVKEISEEEDVGEEGVGETLVIKEGPVIEGDTAPTQVSTPDQIPIPPATHPKETDKEQSLDDIQEEIAEFKVPDWLQDIEAEIPPPQEIPSSDTSTTEVKAEVFEVTGDDKEEIIEEVPDWLKEDEPATPEDTAIASDLESYLGDTGVSEDQQESERESSMAEATLEDDDAFAWLEGLAAKQGAEEALLLSPEERKDKPPAWVEQASAESEAIVADEAPLDLEAPTVETEAVDDLLQTGDQSVAALDISEEETIPLDELELDVPDLESIIVEKDIEGDITEVADIPVSPAALDQSPSEEVPTDEIGYAQTQPLPDLSEVLGEELITPVEELIEDATEQPVDSIAEGSDQEDLKIDEPQSVVMELDSQSELVDTSLEDESQIESVPDLPDWLADVEEEVTAEGVDEWTPSEELLAQTGALDDIPAAEEIETVPLDINNAGLADFERLPGVGFIKAQAIIEHREVHGPYTSVDDLEDVPGLGQAMVDDIRDLVTVEQPMEPIVDGPSDDNQITLIQARNSLIKGDNASAIKHYQSLIKAQQLLPEVIQDLNDALYRHPMDVSIWQTLGDAHVRVGQIQDALDAYTKAEELLR